MLTAMPLGAMPNDTAEFMLGRVAVTPVLLESNGTLDTSTEDWTAQEIAQVLENVATGMQWWVDTLATFATVHELEFVIDDTYALTPHETPYEPITRRSDSYTEYVGKFLFDMGYDGAGMTLEDAMRAFNHSQREKLGTDWSFTIFVVDSSNDVDGMFDPQGSFRQAFAFAGGLFFVLPSGRPASTYTHETGHMFWARDEYAGGGRFTDRRGYYNSQNTNAVDGAPPGFIQQPSIMTAGFLLQQAYDSNTSAAATLAQIGWQDSDGDGIFDVLDVPLELDVSTVYLPTTQTLQVRGTAHAVPLLNTNSSGLQNDITLNRISRVETRQDGGAWSTIATPNSQVAELDLTIPMPGFSTLELRAVDDQSGLASNIVQVSPSRPVKGGNASIEAFVYVDDDSDRQWDATEFLLPGVLVTITDSPVLNRGRLEPDDTAGTIYERQQAGFEIGAVGNQVDGRVAAFSGNAGTGSESFFYASIFGTWGNSWTAIKQELEITLDQPTNAVSIVAVGKEVDSFARIEGYDAAGNLIARETSAALAVGETGTLSLKDPQGRIASIRAFGTAGTEVSLDDFRYGPETAATSGTFGTFQFSGLPDGTYQLALESPSSQYTLVNPEVTVEVVNGVAAPLTIIVDRAVSRWTNPNDAFDVNDIGGVQPLDALIVINELNRRGPRQLGDNDPAGPPYWDVNGDGSITPIDALRIINFLNRQPTSGGGNGGGGVSGEGEPGGSTGSGSGGGMGGSGWQAEGEGPQDWADEVDLLMSTVGAVTSHWERGACWPDVSAGDSSAVEAEETSRGEREQTDTLEGDDPVGSAELRLNFGEQSGWGRRETEVGL